MAVVTYRLETICKTNAREGARGGETSGDRTASGLALNVPVLK